ncbi:MAG: DNA polymerase III subunit gamma/tau [Bacteroidales bacterium]|nr:DNA polymerase III subunit gamma/tau [Bacteroidales bacterium]
MDEYIVSARKYRPDTFEMVVGQDAITQTLKNSIKNNQLGQAYLFCGPRGVGKTTCARIFAKTINCSNPTPDHEPCNECESCRAFIESRSFNIHELDAASNNSVEDIRALIDQVRIPPQLGSYSVYIIDEVHMLSQAAFNAFLKTLEEPPKHAIFILATTEKHKILPTILSRCQIFDFNRINVEDIRKQLEYVAKQEGIEAEQDALHVIAQKADGAMRDALSIFDQIVSFCGRNITYQDTIKNLNVLDYEIYFKITDALLAGNYAEALNIFDDVLKKGFEGGYFINGLASHYRDLLVCKDPNTINLIEVGDKTKEKYLQFAQKCSVPFLFNAIQIANSCDMSYRTSQNKRLLVELSLLKICNISSSVFALPQQQAPKPSVAQSQPQPVVSKPVASEQKPAPAPVAQKPVQTEQPKPQPVSNISQNDGTKSGLLNKIVGLGGTPNASNAEKTAQVATSVANWGNKEFSSSDVTEAWLAFVAEKCPAGTRWNSYFRNHIPEVDESGAYVLKVEDSAMQIRLAERKEVILNFVRTKLDNGSFNFNFVVDEDLVEKNTEVAKTTSERLDELKKNNPEVAGMLSDGDFTQV